MVAHLSVLLLVEQANAASGGERIEWFFLSC